MAPYIGSGRSERQGHLPRAERGTAVSTLRAAAVSRRGRRQSRSSPPSAAEEGAPRAQGPLLLHHGKEARYARRAKRWEGEEDARKQRAPCGDGNSRPNASSPPTPGPLRGSSLLKGERESPSAPSK